MLPIIVEQNVEDVRKVDVLVVATTVVVDLTVASIHAVIQLLTLAHLLVVLLD